MGRRPTWQYILLAAGGLLVYATLVTLLVSAYLKIPVTKLFSFGNRASVNIPPPTKLSPRIPNSPVSHETLSDGGILYFIDGSFVELLKKEGRLWGIFIIRNDPQQRKIRVLFALVGGKIAVGRPSVAGSNAITWKNESLETFMQIVKPQIPILLRVYISPQNRTEYEQEEQRILESVIGGYWSIPEDFILNPIMITLSQ